MSALLVHLSLAQAPPTVLRIAGEIDMASAPVLRHHLLALPDDSTVVELSGVGLLSAAGVTELIDLRDRLARAGVPLALAAARPLVRQVLELIGIADTVILADTVTDAIHLMATPTPGTGHGYRSWRPGPVL